jgi:uncharacterized damage-inducible protein DinB
MTSRHVGGLSVLCPVLILAADTAAQAGAGAEYAKHFGALAKMSVAVAEAMPADKYEYRPHPESMSFGQLMTHIATTNYQFCAGLQDSNPPTLPSPIDKDGVVKCLSASFDYCSTAIPKLTADRLAAVHDSPDGRLPGKEILLAMYVHVAHHRGQAEIYLRNNGIKPPRYMI